jgi:hypothetical protein
MSSARLFSAKISSTSPVSVGESVRKVDEHGGGRKENKKEKQKMVKWGRLRIIARFVNQFPPSGRMASYSYERDLKSRIIAQSTKEGKF